MSPTALEPAGQVAGQAVGQADGRPACAVFSDTGRLPFAVTEQEAPEARIVVFGAPFDGTVSYRSGARLGPGAIRREFYGIETYSPILDRDLEDRPILDAGDLLLPPADPAGMIRIVEDATRSFLARGLLPVLLGGEHLVSLGAIRAAADRWPDLRVLHLDAHADTRDDYLGDRLSHACVLRRAAESLGEGRIRSLGIRSGTRDEFEYSREHLGLLPIPADPAAARALAADLVRDAAGRPTWLTLDLDVLDPSILPGTGTPEPGGLSFAALQAFLHGLDGLDFAGADLVELAPDLDPTGVSTVVACRLLRELLLVL